MGIMRKVYNRFPHLPGKKPEINTITGLLRDEDVSVHRNQLKTAGMVWNTSMYRTVFTTFGSAP
jgi:hypothetical protein